MPPLTDDPPSPASTSRPAPLVAFLDAWAALCRASGRRSLYSALALRTGTDGQREALERALVALGYPEAIANPRSLGAALRALRGRPAPDGRRLDRSAAARGSIWYVVPALERTEAA